MTDASHPLGIGLSSTRSSPGLRAWGLGLLFRTSTAMLTFTAIIPITGDLGLFDVTTALAWVAGKELR